MVFNKLKRITFTFHSLKPQFTVNFSVIGGIIHILSASSGGHVNPAVSFALFLDRRISFQRLVYYVIAQFAGGFAGAGIN